MMNALRLWTVFAVIAASAVVAASAQESSLVDRVTVKDSQLVAFEGAQMVSVVEKISLPNDITVFTNATYKVKEGRERTLAEGEILQRDGMLLTPDGSTYPVYDHLMVNRGRAMIMKDGERAALEADYTLSDGAQLSPDGTLTAKSGQSRRLLDGEILRLDGRTVPGKDTISLRDGKVIVQKDGSMFDVPKGRTLMMNDGTKVFGEGYALKRDGARVTLSEGQTVEVEGVVVRGK
jgi:hypothetical protein